MASWELRKRAMRINIGNIARTCIHIYLGVRWIAIAMRFEAAKGHIRMMFNSINIVYTLDYVRVLVHYVYQPCMPNLTPPNPIQETPAIKENTIHKIDRLLPSSHRGFAGEP